MIHLSSANQPVSKLCVSTHTLYTRSHTHDIQTALLHSDDYYLGYLTLQSAQIQEKKKLNHHQTS